jgi:hypothetical protein
VSTLVVQPAFGRMPCVMWRLPGGSTR